MKPLKFLSVCLIFLLILNIIFYVRKTISTLTFWIIIVTIGLITYKGIPILKKL